MHDGIHFDRAGIPAAAICTDHFVATARATASIWGVPHYPVLYLPHPLSTMTEEALQAEAQRMAGKIVQVLVSGSAE